MICTRVPGPLACCMALLGCVRFHVDMLKRLCKLGPSHSSLQCPHITRQRRLQLATVAVMCCCSSAQGASVPASLCDLQPTTYSPSIKHAVQELQTLCGASHKTPVSYQGLLSSCLCPVAPVLLLLTC